jgi:large subunit ribosomal protein L13
MATHCTDSFSTTDVTKRWYTVDMDGVALGRAAARIAMVLRGKTKPEYTPHADVGDFVIVINASKAMLTGNKLDGQLWRWHTTYIGHLRQRTLRQMMETKPEFMIWKAVKGMLPKGPLGRAMLRKLKVYPGAAHPHEAQKPEVLDISKV